MSEINDDANREIAEITRADDFVVSEKLISLLLTQLTEDRHLAAVFEDLFNPTSAEIYVKPAAGCLLPGMLARACPMSCAPATRGRLGHGLDAPTLSPMGLSTHMPDQQMGRTPDAARCR